MPLIMQADLDSMRTLLGDSVEYFERDLQATHARQSWGLDRIDQVNLPLNGMYSPGDLDGTESHIYVLVGAACGLVDLVFLS